ncbi:hypothetical protein [Nonomuraea bangladeshensis]|uniref:hypothetical protein n=1 Tax=Nonomuraea bangladeshensis TaxID=404385 RepID=UPI0031D91256
MFQILRGALRFRRPPDSGDLMFLCWPVLVYRVVAPVLRTRHLNIIEKVILALCEAGVRQPDELAAKIHQSEDLCNYVLRQLRAGGRVDRHGALTAEGRETLALNRVDEEPELIVTHVFQDPWTGRLWPRSARDLVFERVHGLQDGQAKLRLNSAGSARPACAHVVTAEVPLPRPPVPQEIIAAVAAHRRAELAHNAVWLTERPDGRNPAAHAAEADLHAMSTELTLPHETAVQRVVDIGRPMAEYLLMWVDEGDDPARGPRLLDPFGLDPNPMARRLLAGRLTSDPDLAKVMKGVADSSAARLAEEYRAKGSQVRQAAETRLVQLLGSELRRRPEVLKLLVGLEEAAARGGESGVESVAREAFRIHEYLFRQLLIEYPAPDEPSWMAGTRPSLEVVQANLRMAAEDLGIERVPGHYLQERKVRPLIRGRRPDLDLAFLPSLVPYVLVAAADSRSPHRAGHPMRALVRRRPGVLDDLSVLSGLRNRGSHSLRDATVEDDIDWCRQLALDAARLLISMPPPREGYEVR